MLLADGWAEGEGLGMDVRGSKGFVESLTLLSQRLNARGGEGVGRGEYRFSSLMKQKIKGKNCAVFYFAGKRKIFIIYL